MILITGYYHLNHKVVYDAAKSSHDNNALELPHEKNTAYLVELSGLLPERLSACSKTFTQSPDKEIEINYALVMPENTVNIPVDAVRSIRKINFSPSPGAIESLQYGLKLYPNAEKLFITVDDLGLPSGIESFLSSMLPKEYKEILNNRSVQMLSERKDRNLGTKEINKGIGRIGKDVENQGTITSEVAYNQTGFMVTHSVKSPVSAQKSDAPSCDNGEIAILSHAIAIEKPEDKTRSDVALNRIVNTKQTISCGGYIAGLILNAIKNATDKTEIAVVMHQADDPNIRAKMFDGACITSWLNPELENKINFVTLPKELGRKASIDSMALTDISDRGQPLYLSLYYRLPAGTTPVKDGETAKIKVGTTEIIEGKTEIIEGNTGSKACNTR